MFPNVHLSASWHRAIDISQFTFHKMTFAIFSSSQSVTKQFCRLGSGWFWVVLVSLGWFTFHASFLQPVESWLECIFYVSQVVTWFPRGYPLGIHVFWKQLYHDRIHCCMHSLKECFLKGMLPRSNAKALSIMLLMKKPWKGRVQFGTPAGSRYVFKVHDNIDF